MTLFLVPTPIGNLRDITLRALDVLKEADGVLCEDTRRTGKFLRHFEIHKPLVSFHDHSGLGRLAEIVKELEKGKVMVLVSDSGMPLISDPGFPLVREAIRRGIKVEALPGPSAVVTALAVSGLPTESFTFFGFLSAKSVARRKALTELAHRKETLVFYESPFRLAKALQDMREVFGDREAAVARELTKKFEEIARGRLSDLIARFSKKKVLGEIVILVAGLGRKEVFL